MSEVYFTSDCHFDHANIIKYCNRPFLHDYSLDDDENWTSKHEKIECLRWMNNEIVQRWNEKVNSPDIVYHIGDFCFKRTGSFERFNHMLNGRIVHIRGNHDSNNGTKTYIDRAIMNFGGKTFLVQHIPPRNSNNIPNECDAVLCGHVHENWKYKIFDNVLHINVGVDVWDFEPISVKSVLKLYRKVKDE